jgi:hypothetical protein
MVGENNIAHCIGFVIGEYIWFHVIFLNFGVWMWRRNLYDTLLLSGGASSSGRRIQHVASFEDVEVSSDDDKIENTKLNKKKKKKNAKKKKEEKKKKKNKKHKQQITVDEDAKLKRPNKKLKL